MIFGHLLWAALQVENEENDSSAFDELGRLGDELDLTSVEKDSISGKKGANSEKKKSLTEQRIQYATRGKKHSYCEAEVPDDDHYTCKFIDDECNLLFVHFIPRNSNMRNLRTND